MTNDELAKLAATLSEAQRAMLLDLREPVPGQVRGVIPDELLPLMVIEPRLVGIKLTPLGLAVANHLKETPRAE